MAKENNNKSFVLRIDAATMDALELWAADEFRSINGQGLPAGSGGRFSRGCRRSSC